MYTIARNALKDHYRKNKKSAAFIDTEQVEQQLQDSTTADDKIHRKEEEKILKKALEQLNETDRELIILSRYKEMKYQEIAVLLNLSEGAIKVRIHRAIKQLRENYLLLSHQNHFIMNCAFDKEQLWSLALNELSEAEKATVNLHITSCEACKTEMNEIMAFCNITAALPEPELPAGMKQRFMTELDNYKQQQLSQSHGWSVWKERFNSFITTITTPKFGYGLAMLVVGVLVTTVFFKTKDTGVSEVEQLSSQVKEMREMLALSLLEHPSASERLRAVSYVEEIDTVDIRVKEALLTTLNNDENINVRLTALETLSKMTADPKVREGLIQSIKYQDSPLIQSALADLMLKMQAKKSVRPLEQLLKKPETDEAIKSKIKETIQRLS